MLAKFWVCVSTGQENQITSKQITLSRKKRREKKKTLETGRANNMKDNNIWVSRRTFSEHMELVNCCPAAIRSGPVQTLPVCQINISNITPCSGLLQVLTAWCCSSPGLWGLNHLDDHQHLELTCLVFPGQKLDRSLYLMQLALIPPHSQKSYEACYEMLKVFVQIRECFHFMVNHFVGCPRWIWDLSDCGDRIS